MRAVKIESVEGVFFYASVYINPWSAWRYKDWRGGPPGVGERRVRSRLRTDREGQRKEKGKAYEIWIGFIVDAAFGRGDADFERERSIPDALMENCGGCHSFARHARLGIGWGCGERLA